MTDGDDPYDFGPPSARPHPGEVYGGGSYGGVDRSGGDAGWQPTLTSPVEDFTRVDHGPAVVDPYVIVRTPLVWLLAATVLGLAGAALALLLGEQIGMALGAWVLAGPVAIGLLAVHSLRDTALRTRLGYDPRTAATAFYAVAIVAAAAGITVSAVRIAEWAGRL